MSVPYWPQPGWLYRKTRFAPRSQQLVSFDNFGRFGALGAAPVNETPHEGVFSRMRYIAYNRPAAGLTHGSLARHAYALPGYVRREPDTLRGWGFGGLGEDVSSGTCGIDAFLAALVPRVRSMTGLPNIKFEVTSFACTAVQALGLPCSVSSDQMITEALKLVRNPLLDALNAAKNKAASTFTSVISGQVAPVLAKKLAEHKDLGVPQLTAAQITAKLANPLYTWTTSWLAGCASPGTGAGWSVAPQAPPQMSAEQCETLKLAVLATTGKYDPTLCTGLPSQTSALAPSFDPWEAPSHALPGTGLQTGGSMAAQMAAQGINPKYLYDPKFMPQVPPTTPGTPPSTTGGGGAAILGIGAALALLLLMR